MSTVAKILVVLNFFLAVAFLASAASFVRNQDHWRAKHLEDMARKQAELNQANNRLKEKEADYERVSGQVVQANEERSKAQAAASELRQQNELLKTQIDSLGASLTAATRAGEVAQGTIGNLQGLVSSLQGERQVLTQSLAAATEQKDAAIRQVNQLRDSLHNETQSRVALEGQLTEVHERTRRLEFEVEAARTKLGDLPTSQPAHQGRVLAADNDANVVVISLGAEDGVERGYVYTVSRGTSFVGKLHITDVEAKKSAGRLDRTLQKSPVRAGDAVHNP
jgi:peptidoglycan hydrolase CwlO-like protein